MTNTRTWAWLCFLIGIGSWVPNIVFQEPAALWLITLIVGPVGIVLAFVSQSWGLVIANTMVGGSFLLLMFAGYITVFLSQLI
ncbi:hypothetical protein [Alkalicoccus luteus]|uniref:Uncharacterized protein n=1 Tax=Alkalicoccus luteus TaxID=1237094 RepID=A0A969PTP2_9BACI|nr:hypothetical protein [Alkalicoccus luteus]NJP39315.1 hypothetical protein [Alkalicoccus luteus]